MLTGNDVAAPPALTTDSNDTMSVETKQPPLGVFNAVEITGSLLPAQTQSAGDDGMSKMCDDFVNQVLARPKRCFYVHDNALVRRPELVMAELLRAIPIEVLEQHDIVYLQQCLDSHKYRAPELSGMIWRELYHWICGIDRRARAKSPSCGLEFLDDCARIMKGSD